MPPARRYKKSEASRQAVIDAAIKVLAKRGFARTSVNHIAAEAGMSKGAVHYHFTRKSELISQVLDRCVTTINEGVGRAWEAPGLPTEKIHRALRELRGKWRDGGPELRVLADLMAQGVHDEALREPIRAMFKTNRTVLIDQVLDSLLELGFKPKIPKHIIPRLLLAMLDGLALHDFFDPPAEDDLDEIMKAIEVIAFSLFELK